MTPIFIMFSPSGVFAQYHRPCSLAHWPVYPPLFSVGGRGQWLQVIDVLAFDHLMKLLSLIIWTTAWQNQQNYLCAQRRYSDQPGHPPSLISLCCVLCPNLSSCGQWRLIRLGGCPGWSEFSLGAQVILLVSSCSGLFGPRQANLVLITYASSEGSGEPAHRAVSPEPPLLAHTSSDSRGTFRQKARSLDLLDGWTCAVKICHDGMLKDTNSLDGAHLIN